MQKVVVKVRETVVKDRPLTREEYFAIRLDSFPLIADSVAPKFLENLGYVRDSLHCVMVGGNDTTEFGMGVFRKETIRDATPFERMSYLIMQLACPDVTECAGCPFDHGSGCALLRNTWRASQSLSRDYLKGLDFFVEVEEE